MDLKDKHEQNNTDNESLYDDAEYMMYGDKMGTNEAKIDMLERQVSVLKDKVYTLEKKLIGGRKTKKRKHFNKKRKTKARRKGF